MQKEIYRIFFLNQLDKFKNGDKIFLCLLKHKKHKSYLMKGFVVTNFPNNRKNKTLSILFLCGRIEGY